MKNGFWENCKNSEVYTVEEEFHNIETGVYCCVDVTTLSVSCLVPVLFSGDQPLQQAFKRKGKGVLGTREMRRVHEEGGSDFNIHLVDVYNAKNNQSPVWQAFPSLLPSHFSCTKTHFPFSLKCLPHRLSDVIQSVYPFTLFNIYQEISIFWWLQLLNKI